MAFWSEKPTELVSPFPPAECVKRLRSVVSTLSSPNFGSGVVGYVGQQSVRLRRRIWYGNSFQTCLYGELRPEAGGTCISCRFGLRPFTTIFMFFWFGMASLIGS